jgi:hypothetical protein
MDRAPRRLLKLGNASRRLLPAASTWHPDDQSTSLPLQSPIA